jgi:acid phosphatase family membrane protein YuiD
MPIQFVSQQLRHAPGQEQMLLNRYADLMSRENDDIRQEFVKNVQGL